MATKQAWPHEQLQNESFRIALRGDLYNVDFWPENCEWTASDSRDMWILDINSVRSAVIALIDGDWSRL